MTTFLVILLVIGSIFPSETKVIIERSLGGLHAFVSSANVTTKSITTTDTSDQFVTRDLDTSSINRPDQGQGTRSTRQVQRTRLATSNAVPNYNEQSDIWIWGYDEGNTHNRTNEKLQATPPPVATTSRPCKVIGPADFNTTGHRISETKCAEYLPKIQAILQYHKKYPYGEGYSSTAFIGGRTAGDSEFPHMGAVGWKAVVGGWVFKCGSTLISTKFVLTAAHCTKASSLDTTIADPKPKIVRFGVENLFEDTLKVRKDHEISKIFVHPKYKAPKKYNDIALMEMKKAVIFAYNIYPVCLWNSFDTSCLGSKASGAGWGATETGPTSQTSQTLQTAVLDIIDTKTCDDLLRPSWNRHWSGFQDHQICAGKLAGGVDSCQGDSGGPIHVKIPGITDTLAYYVIGVTSFGFGCALENSPGIYTRVSSFIDWIEDIVWHQ